MAEGTIKVPREVYDKLEASGRMPETAAELERLLEGDLDQYQQETLTMLGTPYYFGGQEIQPLRGIATLAALEAIDSPFLSEDGTEATFTETALTLYIIQGGRELLARIMGIRRRLRGVATTEKWAKKEPAMYEKYLEQVDRIQSEYAPLEKEACEWFATLEDVTLDDAVQLIFEVLKDAWSGLGMVPEKGGDGKIKKKCGSGRLRTLRNWLSRCIRKRV